MEIVDLSSLPLQANLLVFAAAAVAVWQAGTRLSRYADAIAERSGVDRVFLGALLLGGVTSLPEGATTVTAAAIGNAPLAVNNLFGGVAMQVAILAAADAAAGGRAISAEVDRPSVMLEGALLILVLTVAAAGILVGEPEFAGMGAWSTGVFGTGVLAFFLIHRNRRRETWEPEDGGRAGRMRPKRTPDRARRLSTPRLAIATAAASLLILVAGIVLAQSGDVLATQTGLGASFVGAVLVAVSTSLPEVSTTLALVRLGQPGMAFSNIFGTNILDCGLVVLADVAYGGGPVLAEMGRFTLVSIVLGIATTGVYLVGLLQRSRRVILRMGLDSLLVLGVYLGGLLVLYRLR